MEEKLSDENLLLTNYGVISIFMIDVNRNCSQNKKKIKKNFFPFLVWKATHQLALSTQEILKSLEVSQFIQPGGYSSGRMWEPNKQLFVLRWMEVRAWF